jgi:hypothetical protein
MGIKCLNEIKDSDIIVSQVNKVFVAKNDRLKRYRNAIWETIKLFYSFAIE